MQANTFSYYTILNVPSNATPDDIKKAFRAMAHQFHPDKNPGDYEAEEKFKEISRAYEVLSDPLKRSMYDRTGSDNFDGMPGGMHGSGMGCGRKGGCGGRGRGRGAWSHLMQNMPIHEIVITRQEAASGAEISIKPSNASDESAFQVKLPLNLQNGTILQCINGNIGDAFFLRIIIADE